MERVIIITGAAGAGKDTAAEGVAQLEGIWTKAIAEPLKNICCELFGWEAYLLQQDSAYKAEVGRWPDGQAISLDPDTNEPRTRRQLMQLLGSEFIRDMVNPDFWIMTAIQDMESVEDRGGTWVITDCRFMNEFQALQRAFKECFVICVVRTDHEIKDSGHQSEQDWKRIPADVVIEAKTGEIEKIRDEAFKAALAFAAKED